MPRPLHVPAMAAICVALLLGAQAKAESFALGAKAGTTGLGLEATWRVSESINLRTGYYAFDYGTDLEEQGVEYDGDFRLRHAAVFLDWHPFRGRARLSTGAIHTGSEFVGAADGFLDVGDNAYFAKLDAIVGWSGVKPYLGVGLGNAISPGRWSFSFDLGVAFVGSPRVRLDGTVDEPALESAFREDLEREEARVREELSDAKFFPVVSLGVAYRF
jgi:hypothetical protein